MADLKWIDGLRGPLVASFSREEQVGFREHEVATGPAFVQPFSDDTPQFHNIVYQFKEGDARRFQMWLRQNKIKLNSPWFDSPLITEDKSVLTQECRYTSDGYPQLQSKTVGGIYTYSARVITRQIENNDDDYADVVDAMWGTNHGDIDLGSSLLDQSMNGVFD